MPLGVNSSNKTQSQLSEQLSDRLSDKLSDQLDDKSVLDMIVDFCAEAKTKKEICEHLGYSDLTYFTRKYINTLLEDGKLEFTIPEKPKSSKQKYITKA